MISREFYETAVERLWRIGLPKIRNFELCAEGF